MLKKLFDKTRALVAHGLGTAFLYVGAALVAVAVSAILLPFLVGLACLVVAHWAASQEAEEPSDLVTVPATVV